ncbi:MAG TPA: RNA-binding protein, partial [Vicinamibacteria bacterium]|nr:RNA-binding protein [Vicinamibacteria bacterium]
RRSADVHFGLGRVDAQASLPVTLKWRDAAGQPREATLPLAPGWHTVLLGAPATPAPLVAAGAAATASTKGGGR